MNQVPAQHNCRRRVESRRAERRVVLQPKKFDDQEGLSHPKGKPRRVGLWLRFVARATKAKGRMRVKVAKT